MGPKQEIECCENSEGGTQFNFKFYTNWWLSTRSTNRSKKNTPKSFHSRSYHPFSSNLAQINQVVSSQGVEIEANLSVLNEETSFLEQNISQHQLFYINKNAFMLNSLRQEALEQQNDTSASERIQQELTSLIKEPIKIMIVDDNLFNIKALELLVTQFRNI